MSEENRNQITYDENWQTVSYPEYPVTAQSENVESELCDEKKLNSKSDSPKQLLITIQLIICIIIALTAFVIKSFGGDFYNFSREWYYSNLNESAIFDNSNEFDIDDIFSLATEDEV